MNGFEKPRENGVDEAKKMLNSFDSPKATELKKGKDDPEVNQNEPISEGELKKMSKGYPEVDTKTNGDIISQAKDALKKSSSNGKVEHRDNFVIVGKDGHEYVYVRDENNSTKDRLFRSKDKIKEPEKTADELIQEQLMLYLEKTPVPKKLPNSDPVAKQVINELGKLAEGNPPTYLSNEIDGFNYLFIKLPSGVQVWKGKGQ